MEDKMFCFQCQETAKGTGCTIKGVCGKNPDVAGLQDVLVYILKGISKYTNALRKEAIELPTVNRFIVESLFMTITNANFDFDRFVTHIKRAFDIRDLARKTLEEKNIEIDTPCDCMTWRASSAEEMELKAASVRITETKDENVRSLRELVVYGLKGMAAYAEHAYNLGYEKDEIYAFMQKALEDVTNDKLSVDELIALVLETGKFGVETMALLDKANTDSYGNPEITEVSLEVRNNPGILISGHDLKDMEELLKQTEGTGVDVYTHSEMLPANYYPKFKHYKHFVGNYGSAWWNQKKEFETFNGVILFTTNCIVPPAKDAGYKDKVYTTGSAGFPGFKHIPDRVDGKPKDFSQLIEHAKKCAPPTAIESGKLIGGFAHAQVMALADKVVAAVKAGKIKRFFVMAGCDGRMKSRSYYTDFANILPKETIILTAGCAKYRYNKLPLGEIDGIPRVLDAGQCNDSYSLAVIALKLTEVFGVDSINELPISYNIAWYEQKAVIVLLALLSLGVKNIHLGPTLPGFLSPDVANVLVETFGIASIGTPEEDLKLFMN